MTEHRTRAAFSAADHTAVVQLVCDYGYYHDERDFDHLATLFAENAHYTMRIVGGDTIGPKVGRNAIVDQIAEFKSRQTDQRRHVITNIAVTSRDADTAEVRSYVTVLATTTENTKVVTAGVYHDRLARREDRWVITDKLLVLDRGF
jgi:3-phenylpropionate/cinnamic acid dioxygenase small subunit